MYLFVSLFVNLQFVSYYFSALNIFSLNFARTLGHAVDKLLNGSRVNSHGQFRHCLHGRGFIYNRIGFDAVTPFVYTAPGRGAFSKRYGFIGRVNGETASI